MWPKGLSPFISIPIPLGYLKSNLDNAKHEVSIIDCVFHNIDAYPLAALRLQPAILNLSFCSEEIDCNALVNI